MMTSDSDFDLWKEGACQYKCNYCDKLISNSAVFWNHVQVDHHIQPSAYRKDNPDYCVYSEEIQCQICLKPMLYDFGKMTIHLSKAHCDILTLQEYFELYVSGAKFLKYHSKDEEGEQPIRIVHVMTVDDSVIDGSTVAETNVTADLETHDEDNWAIESAADDISNADPEDAAAEDNNGPDENDWVFECPDLNDPSFLLQEPCRICNLDTSHLTVRDLHKHVQTAHNLNLLQYYRMFIDPKHWVDCCLMKCHECNDFTTTVRFRFTKHLKQEHHGMTMLQFTDKHGSCLYGRSMHQCIMCKESVPHHYPTMYYHITMRHSVTLRRYYMKMVKKYKNNLISAKTNKRKLKKGKGSTRPKDQAYNPKKDGYFNTKKKGCYGQSKKLEPAQPKNLNFIESRETWFNGCTYKCDRCPRMYFDPRGISFHLRNLHGLEKGSFDQRRYIVRQTKFTCQICGGTYLRKLNNLKCHIQTHGMTYLEYGERFAPALATEEDVVGSDGPIEGSGSGCAMVYDGESKVDSTADDGPSREQEDSRSSPRSAVDEEYEIDSFLDAQIDDASDVVLEIVSCQLCQAEMDEDDLESHLLEVHDLDRGNYSEMFGERM